MRSYYVNIPKMINQLFPYYLGGRRLIIFTQAICHPLVDLAETFRDWATESRIEASMTSQIIMFEWFLNKQFGKYLLDSTNVISIHDNSMGGVPIYPEAFVTTDDLVVYEEGETIVPGKPTKAFYYESGTDQIQTATYSFVVNCPPINTALIAQEDLKIKIAYFVDRYKLAGKKYIITFN